MRARAGRRGVVRILAPRESKLSAGVEERRLPRYELARRVPADGKGPVLGMPLVPYVEIVLEPLERGQTGLPVPVPQAERRPLVVIVGLAAERDARVDRGRAPHHAPARKPVQDATAGTRAMHLAPVVPAHRVSR